MINDETYRKEKSVFVEEFFLVHEVLIEILKKQLIPLKRIMFGFSYHYGIIECGDGVKIFLRNIPKRMNNPKMVFKIKNFEIETEQGVWDKITIKQKEIEVDFQGGLLCFIFSKPILKLFKNKLQIMKEKDGERK